MFGAAKKLAAVMLRAGQGFTVRQVYAAVGAGHDVLRVIATLLRRRARCLRGGRLLRFSGLAPGVSQPGQWGPEYPDDQQREQQKLGHLGMQQ
jgi:hypothetical protein